VAPRTVFRIGSLTKQFTAAAVVQTVRATRAPATQISRVALGIPLPVVRNLPLSAAERARYVGDYSVGPTTARIREDGDHLTAQVPGRGSFGPLAQGRRVFIASYDENVRFEFQVTGERATGFTLYSGGLAHHASRAS